ncbi:MAG: hypothetical protein JWQ35_2427 [Bacteriovoracaceae bacterium]|nr:hypothetical protein [Bacteriovoracaceae bacterium]
MNKDFQIKPAIVALGILSLTNSNLLGVSKSNNPIGPNGTVEERGMGDQDIDLISKIKRSIKGDPHLSAIAKNIKVTSKNGKVTLSGKVASKSERAAIEKKALSIAGVGHLINKISVASWK